TTGGSGAGAGIETEIASVTKPPDITDIMMTGGTKTRIAEAIVGTGLDPQGPGTDTDTGGHHERTPNATRGLSSTASAVSGSSSTGIAR
ncbi:MAG: hypothetical protein Q9184_008394, partial [Pyrenodesmia sp. 2 TL-2023]